MVERSRRSRRKRRAKQPLLGSHQRCWLWGRHVVLETMKAGKWPIYELQFADELPQEEQNLAGELAEQLGVPYGFESSRELTKTCGSQEHQGYLAKMPPYPYDDLGALLTSWPTRPLFLILDGIQDPYNFGAILRSAEVLGADAVVIGEQGQTGVTSQVARSSAGAVNYLTLIHSPNLLNVIKDWQSRDVQILGASEKSSVPIYDMDLTGPIALLVGNEGFGIRQEFLDVCDREIAIPQTGRVGSLNAAVSAGILLYEVHRQRSIKLT